MTNTQIIKQLKKAEIVLKIIDDKPFRHRAYAKAIDTINELDQELSVYQSTQPLEELPGVGKEISAKISDLLETGKSPQLEELYAKVPQGVFALVDIPGLGPKRAYQLAEEFDLTDQESAVKQLRQALNSGAVSKLAGFGDKLAKKIKQNLDQPALDNKRLLLSEADRLANQVVTCLKKLSSIDQLSVLGSIRRRSETVGDVDIGIVTSKPSEIVPHLKKHLEGIDVIARGDKLIRFNLANKKQVDLKISPKDQWGTMLHHFTGSKQHNITLREYALKNGYSVSEHGVTSKEKLKTFVTEKAFFNYFNMQYIPPELRTGGQELIRALNHKIPTLVELKDVKGALHTHTNYSWISSHDYGENIHELLNAAVNKGLKYIAIGDHNPSTRAYKKSDQVNEVRKRNNWIEQQYYSWKKAVKNKDIKIYKTLEVDINPEGKLNLTNQALDLLDFAIASIHSSFRLDKQAQTNRLLSAIKHSKVKIIAHPTGRLLQKRHPISCQWDAIFSACKKHQVALEINGSPSRLDLGEELIQKASKRGVMLSLGSDAHAAKQLDNLSYAVDTARRGWLEKHQIINCLSIQKFEDWLYTKEK